MGCDQPDFKQQGVGACAKIIDDPNPRRVRGYLVTGTEWQVGPSRQWVGDGGPLAGTRGLETRVVVVDVDAAEWPRAQQQMTVLRDTLAVTPRSNTVLGSEAPWAAKALGMISLDVIAEVLGDETQPSPGRNRPWL